MRLKLGVDPPERASGRRENQASVAEARGCPGSDTDKAEGKALHLGKGVGESEPTERDQK